MAFQDKRNQYCTSPYSAHQISEIWKKQHEGGCHFSHSCTHSSSQRRKKKNKLEKIRLKSCEGDLAQQPFWRQIKATWFTFPEFKKKKIKTEPCSRLYYKALVECILKSSEQQEVNGLSCVTAAADKQSPTDHFSP